ncbi:MAG: hypothetical protein ACLU2J_02865, partial [Clostridia bacterium]
PILSGLSKSLPPNWSIRSNTSASGSPGSEPREPEADVLELIDQFGGMLLDRPERIGFKVDEALVLLEYRNLKGKQNRYLEIFKDFVNRMEAIKV